MGRLKQGEVVHSAGKAYTIRSVMANEVLLASGRESFWVEVLVFNNRYFATVDQVFYFNVN